ncbi:hypothetical protein AAFN60_06405 [Roseibacillus persicicus]|uniref:hypothetical protein n=1 Tax=Roseibacillus persicicus TaxID=454148 RepID=UPI00398BA20D
MQHPDLAQILEKRLMIIADHESRDRDPEAHLQRLFVINDEITSWHESHKNEIDANLEHFLSGASFQKALDYLQSGMRRPCGS